VTQNGPNSLKKIHTFYNENYVWRRLFLRSFSGLHVGKKWTIVYLFLEGINRPQRHRFRHL